MYVVQWKDPGLETGHLGSNDINMNWTVEESCYLGIYLKVGPYLKVSSSVRAPLALQPIPYYLPQTNTVQNSGKSLCFGVSRSEFKSQLLQFQAV